MVAINKHCQSSLGNCFPETSEEGSCSLGSESSVILPQCSLCDHPYWVKLLKAELLLK